MILQKSKNKNKTQKETGMPINKYFISPNKQQEMGFEKTMQVAFNENTSTTSTSTTSTSTTSTSLTPNYDINFISKGMRKEFKEIWPTSPDLVELGNIEPTKPTNPNAATEELVLETYIAKGPLASLQIKKEKLSSDSENENEK